MKDPTALRGTLPGRFLVVLSALVVGAFIALWLLPHIGPAPGRWDKAAHFLFFATLASLYGRVVASHFPRASDWMALAHVMLLGIAIGALDEWHQASVAGRSSSWLDFAADAAGVLTGALVSRTWIRGSGRADSREG